MAELSQEEFQRGKEQPGWKWGPFTARVPFVHTGVTWPELFQGITVAAATGMGLVPLLQTQFGLTFEESIAFVTLQSLLIGTSPIVFGEPYAPGWITPALPLALLVVLSPGIDGGPIYDTPTARFQFMAAVSINLSVLLFVLGVTGLGTRLIRWLPAALKGGIIMGAAIAALKRVFLDDADEYLHHQPISTTVAVALCLLLAFSMPVQRYKQKHRWLRIIASLGLLPGFAAAALIGPLCGEVSYDVEWGILIPPIGDVFRKASPLAIGWPSLRMFVDAIPLAIMGYVIVFGDLITGTEILRMAKPARPDERIDVNFSRSHMSLAVRNALMAVTAPFFPVQGILWTGVHVILVQRWKEGRQTLDSLYTGISSYYVFGIPILYVLLPALTAMKPLMGIALSLTLVLTGFACAYVAMELPTTNVERGVVILMATALAIFPNPWIGMIIGIVATWTLIGHPGSQGPPDGERRPD